MKVLRGAAFVAVAALLVACGAPGPKTRPASSSSSAPTSAKSEPAYCTHAVFALHAFSSASAVLGGACMILQTSNGGRSWSQVYSGSVYVSQFDFLTHKVGWALGGMGSNPNDAVLLRTEDGGQSWTRVSASGLSLLRRIDFASPMVGYGLINSTVVKTSNRGSVWTPIAAPKASYLCFTTPSDGWLADLGAFALYRTGDGGKSWALDRISQQSTGRWLDLSCPSSGVIWGIFQTGAGAGSSDEITAVSADNGTTWSTHRRIGDIQPLVAVSATTAYGLSENGAVTNGNYLASTMDGGARWTYDTLPFFLEGDNLSVANDVIWISTANMYLGGTSKKSIVVVGSSSSKWATVYHRSYP